MKDSFSFGTWVSFEKAKVALLPVPWEVTVSGGRGTSKAPLHIKKASHQLDFYTKDQEAFNHLIYFCDLNSEIQKLNKKYSKLARKIINSWEEHKSPSSKEMPLLKKINQACKTMTGWIYKESKTILQAGKIPALIGGDHSISEGLLKLLGEQHKGDYGILHIDAHLDMRKAFQGFTHSHASVMYNVLHQTPPPGKLIQVGIRDFCEEEYLIKQEKIIRYFDEDLQERLFKGESWLKICEEIIAPLPQKIYVSLDVDGLEQIYAPHTGTPVPGGLSYNQVLFLLKEIKKQNKVLIGFDVVETNCKEKLQSPHNCWNGNVSARLIYALCGLALNKSG